MTRMTRIAAEVFVVFAAKKNSQFPVNYEKSRSNSIRPSYLDGRPFTLA